MFTVNTYRGRTTLILFQRESGLSRGAIREPGAGAPYPIRVIALSDLPWMPVVGTTIHVIPLFSNRLEGKQAD